MAMAEQRDPVIKEETKVYNESRQTTIPKYVRKKLGGLEKGDKLLWVHEADGSITLDKKGDDGD